MNNKIQLGFSGSAGRYDHYSSLHREIADDLFTQVVKGHQPSSLLDVGCGTGYLTVRFKEHFPQSRIVGLDFAQGMLEAARLKDDDIDWVLADGQHLPFHEGSFDILISNLAYQWADDLTRAFIEARRVLSTGGILACTLFGYNTCQELFQSLYEVKTKALQFTRLPNEVQIEEALVISGFKHPQVNGEHIKIGFKDMYGLLAWLKSIGANHLPREGYLGSAAIARAATIYREKFSHLQGIEATFEVIRVYAKK